MSERWSGVLPRMIMPSTSPIEQLSDREFEVFHLIGLGRDNQAIATQLHLSLKTVAVHQVNIRRKLNLASTSDLIRFAVRWESAHPGE